jgi:hypothetical protein
VSPRSPRATCPARAGFAIVDGFDLFDIFVMAGWVLHGARTVTAFAVYPGAPRSFQQSALQPSRNVEYEGNDAFRED